MDSIEVTDDERQMVVDGLIMLRRHMVATQEGAQESAAVLLTGQIQAISELITRVMGVDLGG